MTLASFELFKGLSYKEYEKLAGLIALDDVETGKVFNVEGDTGYRFVVIAEGEAEVLQNGELVRRLGPGDHFGEIAILSEGRRTATVVAATPMKVLVMFGTAFRLMEDAFPTVAQAIYSDAARFMNDDDTREG
ncbi:MAG TPA: cyclic nucleotide-binding domain-containing protein [Nocardioidaceae bacterium]|nr:cyclic nucleotide-binding domain-containing protein [Nocardioidaceae bacterium]